MSRRSRAREYSLAAAILIVLGGAVASCTAPPETPGSNPAEAEAQVRAALEAWPGDFTAERTAAVCGLFAQDAVLSYPGSNDRTAADACTQFAALFASPDKVFSYAAPEIEEVLVYGETVIVRLIWTLTVADAAGKTIEVAREKGVDVFRRQTDGTWKIRVSHAYPL